MSAAEEENDESFIEGSKNKIKPWLCLLRAWESWRLFVITRRPHDEEGAPPPPPAPLAETDLKKHHKMADDGESKKKKKGGAATPSLRDCANCGAPEGTVSGSPAHSVCSRCKITYYCSVKCHKRHWKQGGHKQHCMTPEQRSASAAAAAAEESSPKRGVAAEEEEGECAICLESLGSGVEILECGHRFHKACVDELIKRDVQQACPLCRVELPYNPKKREG